jgi:hypothetical protein
MHMTFYLPVENRVDFNPATEIALEIVRHNRQAAYVQTLGGAWEGAVHLCLEFRQAHHSPPHG